MNEPICRHCGKPRGQHLHGSNGGIRCEGSTNQFTPKPCHFNSRYLILMKRMLEDDRNLLAQTRDSLVDKIDELRTEHTRSGCDCWSEALRSMDTIALVNKRAS